MNPIINPWWIYLITRLDSIKNLCDIVMALTGVITILSLIVFFTIRDATDNFFQTTYTKIQNDVIYNAKRLKNMFGNYADEFEVLLQDKDDKAKLKELRRIADTCCSVLQDIQKDNNKLIERSENELRRGKFYKKIAIVAFSIFCTMLVLKTIIPNTTVGYQILAASYITPDNLDLAKNTSKEAIEWIIQTIITSIQNMR